jgi:hypothetical protein
MCNFTIHAEIVANQEGTLLTGCETKLRTFLHLNKWSLLTNFYTVDNELEA